MDLHRRIFIALILCAACNRSPSTSNKPQDVVEFDRKSRTFQVDPLTSLSWMQSFTAEFGCKTDPSCRTAGQTRIAIEPHYAILQPPSGPCSLNAVHVIVHTTVVTPEWESPAASTARRAWWRDIQTRIVAHERRHEAIADEYGRMLADSLQAIRPTSCVDVRVAADQTIRRVMRSHQDRQNAFDRSDGPVEVKPPPP